MATAPQSGFYFVPGPSPPPPGPTDVTTAQMLDQRAQSLIRNNVLVSLGIGLIPVPGIDVAALLGQQLYMIRNLGEIYGQSFKEDLGKKALLSVVGSMLPRSISWKIAASSLLKTIPILGTQLAVLSTPLLASATTYALGELFNRHFASGGTFLSFDPVRQQRHFEHLLEAGLRMARAEQAAGPTAWPVATAPMAAYVASPMATGPIPASGGVRVDSSGVVYGAPPHGAVYGMPPTVAQGPPPTVTHGVTPVVAHADVPPTTHVDAPATPHVDQAIGVAVPTTHVDAPATPHVDRSVNLHADLPSQSHVDAAHVDARL